jgi:hypothetical protein
MKFFFETLSKIGGAGKTDLESDFGDIAEIVFE